MIPSQTKLALHLCAALLFFGGGTLWCYASDWGGRAGGVEVTLAHNAKGEVVATLHSRTRERKEFFTSPHRLEVFERGFWRTPQATGSRPRCGLREVEQVRVSICADADFRTGWVTSGTLTLTSR